MGVVSMVSVPLGWATNHAQPDPNTPVAAAEMFFLNPSTLPKAVSRREASAGDGADVLGVVRVPK